MLAGEEAAERVESHPAKIRDLSQGWAGSQPGVGRISAGGGQDLSQRWAGSQPGVGRISASDGQDLSQGWA